MNTNTDAKKTILYDVHISLGARMAPFGGFLMPIQYEGIIAEHTATRTAATLFDTCHMGEFKLTGPGSVSLLDKLCTCNVASIRNGRCRYGMMCNENGGVLDDLVIYRIADEEFMLVVNAGTQDDDFRWITAHAEGDVDVVNISNETAKVDIQGPRSAAITAKLLEDTITDLGFYTFKPNRFESKEVIISRTGYTGEMGFEFYGDSDSARNFWMKAMELGAAPAGLGARDTLRLEMGMPLYGHEMDANRNASESGFTKAICGTKNFIGSEIVLDDSRKQSILVGIELDGRRAARQGNIVQLADGTDIGIVTSGSFSPSLEKAIALAYIKNKSAETGADLLVVTERQTLNGHLVELPFYKKATARRDVSEMLKA